jgi:hypothetical protein
MTLVEKYGSIFWMRSQKPSSFLSTSRALLRKKQEVASKACVQIGEGSSLHKNSISFVKRMASKDN